MSEPKTAEVTNVETVGDYVREYEFRGDGGDYTPNEGERLLIEDALHGWISRAHGGDVRGVSFDGDDLSEAFRAGAMLAASPPAETGEGVGVGLVKVTIFCPNCSVPYVDEGEWTTRPHKTHQCQSCGEEWRPFPFSTVGIAHPASDQSDMERLRADDCSRFVFVEALAKATFAQKHGPTAWRLSNVALRQQWISRTQDAIQSARAALAEKAADK